MNRSLPSGPLWPLAIAIGMLLAAVAAGRPGSLAAGSGTDDQGFEPVAPAGALHQALAANLKIVQGWLDEQDYQSAAEAAEGLALLAGVYSYHSDQAPWRKTSESLREACTELVSAGKSQDATRCTEATRRVAALLEATAGVRPDGPKVAAKEFKSAARGKALMKLMDGTYSDAKAAKASAELERLAYTLAEGANIAEQVRGDAAWRQAARDARDAALAVAAKAKEDDLAAARAELKNLRSRCDACHRHYRK